MLWGLYQNGREENEVNKKFRILYDYKNVIYNWWLDQKVQNFEFYCFDL